MPFYNLSKGELKLYKENIYYPTDSIPADNIPNRFEKFWLWISIQYTAKQYTGATVATFKVLKTEFFITTQLNTLIELSFYLHKLFELTNGFKSLPTDIQVTNAYQIFHNTSVNNNANMNKADNNNPRNVGNLLENTLNNNTNAITTTLQNNLNAINALTTANQNCTTSKCQLFEAAFAVNRWPDNRKVALAARFLKEAAHDWYEDNKGIINQWHIDYNANNFDIQFIAYFATAARMNQWTRELQNIKQRDNESVKTYS
ncbi:17833_t:CDS:2 [Rhizophagus irregularis]|nr:17833_t:CDS:2 [Rhizophagus irregularis]